MESIYSGSSTSHELVNIDFAALLKSIFIAISTSPRRDDVVTLLSELTIKCLEGITKSKASGARLYVDHLEFVMRDLTDIIRGEGPALNVSRIRGYEHSLKRMNVGAAGGAHKKIGYPLDKSSAKGFLKDCSRVSHCFTG